LCLAPPSPILAGRPSTLKTLFRSQTLLLTFKTEPLSYYTPHAYKQPRDDTDL